MGQLRPTEGQSIVNFVFFASHEDLVYCYYTEDTVEKSILDLAAKQGQSLYTRDNSAGTLNVAPFALASSKNAIDSPAKKKQKGDFVFKLRHGLEYYALNLRVPLGLMTCLRSSSLIYSKTSNICYLPITLILMNTQLETRCGVILSRLLDLRDCIAERALPRLQVRDRRRSKYLILNCRCIVILLEYRNGHQWPPFMLFVAHTSVRDCYFLSTRPKATDNRMGMSCLFALC